MEITGLFHFPGMVYGCCQALRDGFKASREKTYSDPLLVEIRWHTNTNPYGVGSEKIMKSSGSHHAVSVFDRL